MNLNVLIPFKCNLTRCYFETLQRTKILGLTTIYNASFHKPKTNKNYYRRFLHSSNKLEHNLIAINDRNRSKNIITNAYNFENYSGIRHTSYWRKFVYKFYNKMDISTPVSIFFMNFELFY